MLGLVSDELSGLPVAPVLFSTDGGRDQLSVLSARQAGTALIPAVVGSSLKHMKGRCYPPPQVLHCDRNCLPYYIAEPL